MIPIISFINMTISTIILAISFITYVYFGFYVFFMNPGSKTNRSFLYLCLAFFLWSLAYLLLNITSGNNEIINKAANISRFIYAPLLFRFFMIFTGYHKKIKNYYLYNALIWLITLFYIFYSIFDDKTETHYFTGYLNLFSHIIFNIINLCGVASLIFWGKFSKLKREKRQSHIIIFGAILTITITIISDYISDSINLPVITPALVLIWFFFIFYAIITNQFMAFIPTYINQDIIDNINELIILLDNNKKIIYANNRTKSIINEEDIEDSDISAVIYEHAKIYPEIDKLLENKFRTFSCRVNFLMNKKSKIPVDAIFSAAKDKYSDPMGILIIGNELKGLNQLKLLFKITAREAEIIQELVDGFTNPNIAKHMGISENTLKRHIANIYLKLDIRNRVELLNFLKDLNLVPGFKAERTLLILNNKEE
ncbi:MAG: hypothetical protein JW864_15030 [Spirochaetes bacterium]|nr:hypothetical protein [Spirochaetota bacterium]